MQKAKTILFRADSSSIIGTGHIMRDLVLAQKYAQKGAKVIFATQELNGNINYKIDDAGFEHVVVKNNSKKELARLIHNLSVDLLVIDHYGIGYKKEKYIKEKTGVKILSFDDTYEKHYCDILLNHNISAKKRKYKNLVPQYCKVKCGKKYTLLRDEFYKEKQKKYKKSKKTTVLIAMGGADTAELNLKILKVLEGFSNLKVIVVTTTANKNLNRVQKFVKNKSDVELHINSNKVAKLMAKSDFAIITPSVTVNEVIFMELPFIAIQTASNQQEVSSYLLKNGYNVLKRFDRDKLEFFIDLYKQKIEFINFIHLSKKEKKIVFQMRNDIRIRKWMYNKEPLNYKKHLAYIKNLTKANDKVYFLLKQKNRYIGVVDLSAISHKDNSAELGIYANPDLKGYGSLLMTIIIKYAFSVLHLNKLYANVFKENQRAINLYQHFGFIEREVKQSNATEVLKMELSYENR
jgi:UDP-2,4-diacetamido-2,4,6-trideoxy-beta-L-altropyranose hydrolase/UDP-4-amino-4,6-dideoxy-N-acetyl-beta-L-altrosamine N-acetyltransferase